MSQRTKVGRNEAKCARYRATHEHSDGSKRPKKPGSNPRPRVTIPDTAAPRTLQVTNHQTTVAFQMTATRSRLLDVPKDWVR